MKRKILSLCIYTREVLICQVPLSFCFLFVLLFFHTQMDSYSPKKNIFVFDYSTLRYTQKLRFCLISTRKVLFLYALFLERCPKALNHCVIVTITFFAHTSLDGMLGKHHLIADARIFAATIGMMHQASSWLSLEQCHRKCCLYKFCIMLITHRPSNNFREYVSKIPATKRCPSRVSIQVKSVTHFLLGASAVKSCSSRFDAIGNR